ncbi:hypothetical protein N9973_00050 [bacterium]|nr:hypothetical protein [bacterium]
MKQHSNKNKFDVNLSTDSINRLKEVFALNKEQDKFADFMVNSNKNKTSLYSKLKRFFGK